MITKFNSIETNEFADRRKSYDGGGYFQPEITATGTTDGTDWELWLHDTSCGAFGSRIDATLTINDKSYNVRYGSMYKRDDLDFSEIPGETTIINILDEIAEEMGYHIPTRFNYIEKVCVEEYAHPEFPHIKVKVYEYIVDGGTPKLSDFEDIADLVYHVGGDPIFIGKLTDEMIDKLTDEFSKYDVASSDKIKYDPNKEYFIHIANSGCWEIFAKRQEVI